MSWSVSRCGESEIVAQDADQPGGSARYLITCTFSSVVLQLFGLNHEKLTYRFQGRDFRLTDVGGKVVEPLLG